MATKKPAATEKATSAPKTGYTATQMAEALGITPAELRKHLRSTGAEKPAGGWTWDSEKTAASVKKAVEARIKELASAPPKEKAPAKKPAAEAQPAEAKKPAAKKPAAKKPTAK